MCREVLFNQICYHGEQNETGNYRVSAIFFVMNQCFERKTKSIPKSLTVNSVMTPRVK